MTDNTIENCEFLEKDILGELNIPFYKHIVKFVMLLCLYNKI